MQKLILCFLYVSLPLLSIAQDKKKTEQEDSLKIYKKIHRFASKRKLTYLLYEAVFVEPKTEKKASVKQASKKKTDPFKRFKGRVIRNIEFISLDPFGTDINNIKKQPEGFLIKSGNKLHISTTRFALKNQILFREGDRLDVLKMKESERILRKNGYIRDAKIIVHPLENTKDTVDVTLITQDIWSIIGTAVLSTTSSRVRLVDRNFVGSGQTIDNQISYNYKSHPKIDITGSYVVPNIRRTFVSASVYYKAAANNYYQGLSIDRQFYSSITKWAGGVNLFWNQYYGTFNTPSSEAVTIPLGYNSQDIWFGRSYQIISGKADVERSARFVATGRVYKVNYSRRPAAELDPLQLFQHSTLYLGSIGYSTRLYYQDKNIFRFGYTEDVPEGRLLALIAGVEKREFNQRFYTGIKLSGGNHIDEFGYLAGGFEYGTFYREKKVEKAVLAADLTYFTDLQRINRWNIRQFIYARYIKGVRRDPNEFININNDLYGFRGNPILGTSKLLINFQNVVYTPLRFIGFQFGFVGFAGFGLIGNEERSITRSKVYQAYGLGVLIRNEHLVVNTFQFSLGFYPNLAGKDSYRFNPITNYDLRFKDYFLSKPDVIAFQ